MVWVSFRCLLANTFLTKALLPALHRVLVVPNFFHLIMVDASVFFDLQYYRNVLVPFPRSVPQHNPVSELYGQFLQLYGLVFALTCTVNCGTLYRQVYFFEFTTGGLQLRCRNISRMINGNRMHLSSILSLIAKGLNTYVIKLFFFFNLKKLYKNIYIYIFALSWCLD